MLQKFRKSIDNIIFRIFLSIIAIAMVGWGVDSFLKSANNFDVIKFKNAPNVSEIEFQKHKARYLYNLKKYNNLDFYDDLDKKQIDLVIKSELIRTRMFDEFINQQNVIISDELIANNIKKLPNFHDDKGNFSIEIFKNILSSSGYTEEEFYNKIKKDIASVILMNDFMMNDHFPDFIFQKNNKFLSLYTVVDLISINKLRKDNLVNITVDQDSLKNFYKLNKSKFLQPEERVIKYIEFIPNIKISDSEIESYFNDNRDSFDQNEKLAKVKNHIKDKILSTKHEEYFAKLVTELEDLVSAGDNIFELSKKFNLEVKEVKFNKREISSNKKFKDIENDIFKAELNETSFPHEISYDTNKALILYQVSEITDSRVLSFEESANQLEKLYKEDKMISHNLEIMKNITKDIDSENYNEIIKKHSLNLEKNIKFYYYIPSNNKKSYQSNLVKEIVSNNKKISDVIETENKFYIIVRKLVDVDDKKSQELEKSSKDNTKKMLHFYLVEDIMEYFTKLNSPSF